VRDTFLAPTRLTHPGAEISKQLAAKGCKVAINYAYAADRAQGTLEALAGSGHVLIQGDAFDRPSVKRIADEAVAKLGGIDIVVSNAGWTQFAAFDDLRE
jgi:NAD(P)-dependent dehydrogenase (short-subunit alcohol dehydrogenase family)